MTDDEGRLGRIACRAKRDAPMTEGRFNAIEPRTLATEPAWTDGATIHIRHAQTQSFLGPSPFCRPFSVLRLCSFVLRLLSFVFCPSSSVIRLLVSPTPPPHCPGAVSGLPLCSGPSESRKGTVASAHSRGPRYWPAPAPKVERSM